MKPRYKYPFLLFFLSLSTYALGQFTAPRFQRLTIADGLPNGEVRQIREDADGFIWLATAEGICRFDGYKTQLLRGRDEVTTTALNADRPLFFDWDAQKRWWIGSDWAGVRLYNPTKNDLSFIRTPEYAAVRPKDKVLDTVTMPFIYSVLFDGNHRVWLGTASGLQVFDIAKNRMDKNPKLATPLFKDGIIQQLNKDASGNIWAAVSTKGLCRFDKSTETWSIVVEQADVRSFSFDTEGGVFFITAKELRHYNTKTGVNIQPNSLIIKELARQGEFMRVHCDRVGRLWLGTANGLIVLRGGGIPPQIFKHDPHNPFSLLADLILNIYEDSKGNIWVCCGGDGVCMLPNSFERIQVFDNRTLTHRIEDIGIAPDSTVYAVTLTHLIISRSPYHKTDFLPITDLIPCKNATTGNLTIGKNGKVYLGTECGVWQYMPLEKRCQLIVNPRYAGNAVKGRSFLSLNIWGDTLLTFSRFIENGLHVFNLKTRKYQWLNDSVLSPEIVFTKGMVQDKSGEFWSNSYKGLIKMGNFPHHLDTFRFVGFYFGWQNYDSDVSNGGKPVILIGDDIWWGRYDGGGLNVMSLRDTAYNVFLKINGLCDNSIQSLVQDKSGYLWAGTNLGISRIQLPTDFRTAKRIVAQNFSTADGLPHNNVLCSKTTLDGNRVFAGTSGGLAVLNTEGGASDTISPKLVFTSLSILNKTVYPNDSTGLLKVDINNTDILTLQHNQAFFTLEVSGLNFANPHLTRYAYRLSGLHGDWIDNEFNNIISFNNIAAGDYTLEVKAQSNTGLWSAPKRLTINVLSPIWKRTWFIILSILAFLSAVYGMYRYRLNQILSVQNMKNAIAADLHDDVGATLSNVNILTTLVRQRLPNDIDVLPLLKRIEEEISTSSESLDDIIWSVNPKNDSMERVLSRMRQYANEVFDAKEIEGTIDFDAKLSNLSLPMEKRRDFYLIFKEALNNLSKYAQCNEATISLKETDGKLKLIVSDNGVGFDPLSKKEGNGQKTMRQRAERLKAELTIDSVLGTGTRLELILPLV